jgi:hypothetical protein
MQGLLQYSKLCGGSTVLVVNSCKQFGTLRKVVQNGNQNRQPETAIEAAIEAAKRTVKSEESAVKSENLTLLTLLFPLPASCFPLRYCPPMTKCALRAPISLLKLAS